MMFWKKPYARVMIQIFLVVSMSIAFSFIVNEGEKNLVSAAEVGDFISTCIESNEGTICQEFLKEDCNSNCKESCIENSRDNVPECELGTCYNPVEGDCLPNSPKKSCEDFGGEWNEDVVGNLPECELGCCLTGEQASFITEQGCRRIRETTGILTQFKPEINDELSCWQEARAQKKGACILREGEGVCRLLTQRRCSQLNGDFFEDFLCSHPDLETDCEKQISTNCIEGEDEIYWIDSCGNRENIYEGSSSSQKDHSWNEGKILLKSDACFLTDSNSDVCGNCNLLGGSTICGDKTFSERLKDGEQDVVCKEASCIDEEGNIREHGESWCFYQGAANPDEGDRGYLRSVSTPGSKNFKLWCYEGEISNVSCGERRDKICEESQVEKADGGTISTAMCRSNLADQCIGYNFEDDGMELCNENPDCYAKKVDVSQSKFKFNFCVPKYPKGFNMESSSQVAEDTCGIASMTCNVAKIKKVGKDKWINKGCLREGFTKQMNDFCMSLGDCGASVNYIGEFSDSGYRIKKAPKLGNSYIQKLKTYSIPNPLDFIKSASILSFVGSLGLGNKGEIPSDWEDEGDITKEEGFESFLQGAGFGGMALKSLAPSTGAFAPFVTAIAGAAIGAAIAGYAIEKTGISAGISPALAYALIGTAAVGGAMVALAPTGPVGWIIIAVVLIVIGVLKLVGIGDVKIYKVTFTCKAWQPPTGGEDCSKCYDDDLGCSKYSCENLGAGCKFVNEGSIFEECKYVPSDASPPQINPNYEVLTEGFSYENISNKGFKVAAPTEGGCIPAFTPVTIGLTLNEPGRCTFSVENVAFDEGEILGFLDEGEYNPEDFGLGDEFLGLIGEDDSLQDYDEDEDFQIDPGMDEFYFGGNNLFLENHTHPIYLPSLGSLGVGGFSPDRRVDFELKIRCEDTDGNKNPVDYVIKTCLMPEKDIFPPIVMTYDPLDNLTNHNSSEQKISIYTNEPAECKWSSMDKDYNNMENYMECENEPEDVKPRGFECSTNLAVNSENITYYARCLDQPWLKGTENESERHAMEKSHVISLKRSEPLEIISLSPKDNEVLTFGTEPASLKVEIKTSGGGYNGNAECSYLFEENWITLADTFDDEHEQIFNQFSSGKKELNIKCEDIIGNVAYETSNFKIDIDNTAPEVVRAYYELNNLKIITNEPAVCYYDYYGCNFDVDNASSMTFGLSTTHSTDWEVGKTYYIKCIDTWRNWKSGCSKIIKPGEF